MRVTVTHEMHGIIRVQTTRGPLVANTRASAPTSPASHAPLRFVAAIGVAATVFGCKTRFEHSLSTLASDTAPAIASGLNLSDINTTLTRQPNIDSIDKFLASLPEEYRRHFVAMYRSESSPDNSFAQPRIIFFGAKPSLFMAFNGVQRTAKQEHIELLQFDEYKRRYIPALITLRAGQRAVVQENPAACARCHGYPARPLWDAYHVWPGAYGSGNYKNLDEAPTLEGSQFADFVAKAPKLPRYRHLVGIDRYYDKAATMRMTEEIADNASKFIVQRIKDTKNHEAYKYAIQAALLGCAHIDEYLPTAVRRKFPERIETFYQTTMGNIGNTFEQRLQARNSLARISNSDYRSKGINFAADEQHWKRVASLRYLLERDGNSIGSWFNGIAPESYTAGFSSTITVSLSYQHAALAGISQSASCDKLKAESLSALTRLANTGTNILATGMPRRR